MATLRLIASGAPPRPLPDDIHPEVSAVVSTALAFEAGQRFVTAAHLQQALENAMIRARLETSTSEVATFAAQYLGQHAEKRRLMIESALVATGTRASGKHRNWLIFALLLAGLLTAVAMGTWLAYQGHAR